VVDAAVSTDAAPVEDLARKERKRIMELIESQGMLPGSYPKFDVAVKGQKVVLPTPKHSSYIVDTAEQYLVLCSC
jgi:hypothetical protein